MTTEHFMLNANRSCTRTLLFSAAIIAALPFFTSCAHKEDFRQPTVLVSPYANAQTDVLWAVAPLRNESGVSVVDTSLVTDSLIYRLSEVEGLTILPQNRVIHAMREIGITSVSSPDHAIQLARRLGVDAIVAGSLTAWDPYNPPEIGLSLVLFGESEAVKAGSRAIDPLSLQRAPSDFALSNSRAFDPRTPLATVALHLDASSDAVRIDVRRFAEGRHDPESSLGWKKYIQSMKLFTEYASQRLAQELIDAERLRLARATVEETTR